MVATGLHRGADVVTLDIVALFGLPESPGNEPYETHVTSGDAIDLTGARTRDQQPPTPAAAEQVGPLGGGVGAPAKVAESNSSDQNAAPKTTDCNG